MRSRHVLFLAFVALGCSSREDVAPALDSAALDSSQPLDTFVELDSAVDDTSVELDSTVDDTLVPEDSHDASVEDVLDADAFDAAETFDALDASDAVSDVVAPPDVVVAADGSVSWPPVCAPTPPSEAGVDADFDVGVDAESDAETGACTAVRVRIVAANLTSGNFQRYEPPGMRILQGLHPDIVMLQEMNYAGVLRDFVDTTFGATFQYYIEPGSGGIPNGIVSRYPIIASGEWDDPDLVDRDFAWARIDIPGPIDLWAVSIHLRTASPTARDTEAKKLVDYIKANVPTTDYLVIGGDLNTDNELEPALTTFATIAVTSAPYAVDQAGSNKTNTTRSKPYDWLIPSTSLHARMIPVRIGGADFPSGLVLDTRVFTPIADVAPAFSTDSAALSMQHMAVVRDYAFGP